MERRVPKVIASGTKGTKKKSSLVAQRVLKVITGSIRGARGHRWQHEGCPRSSLAARGVPKFISGRTRGAQDHRWWLKIVPKFIAGGRQYA